MLKGHEKYVTYIEASSLVDFCKKMAASDQFIYCFMSIKVVFPREWLLLLKTFFKKCRRKHKSFTTTYEVAAKIKFPQEGVVKNKKDFQLPKKKLLLLLPKSHDLTMLNLFANSLLVTNWCIEWQYVHAYGIMFSKAYVC